MTKFRLTLAGVLLIALSALTASPAFASTSARHTTYSFDLTSGNSALATASDMMTSPGDRISVKGSGTFDPVAGRVKASGKFVHYTAAGAVHCRGTWKATSFTGFVDFGVNSDGEEGGVLSLVVSHYCSTMGMTMTGIPMTVTSTVNAPAGYVEGITMGPFGVPLKGAVVMQPEQ